MATNDKNGFQSIFNVCDFSTKTVKQFGTVHTPCRYLVNLFIYDYLLKGLYGLLQIVFVLIVRLMGDGLDPY